MWRTVDEGVGGLFPGYFALAMATGIVSLAAYMLGLQALGWALFWANIAAYATLWLLTMVRLARYPGRILADLTDYGRGPGFFTIVAATCILGNEFLVLQKNVPVAIGLWWIGAVLWLILMYTFFTAVTIREQKPSLETGLHGGWLLAVVSTQAVSLLGACIAPAFGERQPLMLFTSLALFLIGCMLYILIISLIFYRWTFFSLAAAALTPAYWINMGAVAITTRAGATLILNSGKWSFLQDVLPFLKGFTLFFWATATWWIPLLVALTVWRHVRMRYPLAYEPLYWGLVFPLGMYTVCTVQLSQVQGLGFLYAIPRVSVYVALAAWMVGAIGLTHRLMRGLIAGLTEGQKGRAEREAALNAIDL
jgi:tellurite resistance protein TehA-like permease